jgi:hypothetical protein
MASKEYKQFEQQEYEDYIRKETTCSECGKRYGHHNTKVCLECCNCSKCCSCKTPNLIPAKGFPID